MTDQYAVIGNPIAHSKSPEIHRLFARQTGEDMDYGKILAPEDGFVASVKTFMAAGGKGMNVTVPFKQQAFKLCDELSERARRAGAVNTLTFIDGKIHGDNTDGFGLVNDLVNLHHTPLHKKNILILGAGGAVRGILQPVLEQQPAEVLIANRTASKAEQLADQFRDLGQIQGGSFKHASTLADQRGGFDVIINGTSASLAGDLPPISTACIHAKTLCYDMMYGNEATVFNRWAGEHGAAKTIDGLGMLIGQAAEAFRLWRGVMPAIAPVIAHFKTQD